VRWGRLASFLVLAAGLALIAGWLTFDRWLSTPLDVGSTPVRIEIPRGQPLARTARELEQTGVLKHARWLSAYADFTGADAKVRAGEYDIPAGTTPRTLLDLFVSGAVVQHSVTIVEGWTFRDLRKALERTPNLVNTLAGKDDAAVMSALGEAGQYPEGLFFPDTYLFDKGSTDVDVLRQSRGRMKKELDKAWAGRAKNLPLADPYQALILASIIEKETALASERLRISGVFTQRLRKGMRLQTDPSVIYGLGAGFDGNLRRSDLERDGPYNTYTRAGLPPTPIALPGAGSLAAAVQPDERGELYFVATGDPDGSHAFSRTLTEHERAVAQYLKRYRQQRKGN
jgi:UPF0755 protein